MAVERVQDGLGIAVERLSGESELAGALRDLAVGPVEVVEPPVFDTDAAG